MMMMDAITTMAPNVQAGQVRALGTSALQGSKVLPDVPTIAEAGVPGYEATIWIGIMAPVGTPKPIVDKLNAEINKAIGRPEMKTAWDRQGATPMTMSPAEFDTLSSQGHRKVGAGGQDFRCDRAVTGECAPATVGEYGRGRRNSRGERSVLPRICHGKFRRHGPHLGG
jgi:Tripartite tricarboxylate transporter family receptor